MPAPIVVKLGGDALASPRRIASEARRLADLARVSPVVAVASARRGVTDHLLGLVRDVQAESGTHASRTHAEAHRAVAAGEVVTAALLALALEELGVPAASLDSREAGLIAGGHPPRIRSVRTTQLSRLLERGVVPVVTGFQAWHRGRVTTLARGGTDATAVALARALCASRVLFVKDAEGLRTADPRLVPDSRPITEAPHRFLSALARAGSRVIQADAADEAEAAGLELEFHSLDSRTALTVVSTRASATGLRAVTLGSAEAGRAPVTVLAGSPDEAAELAEPLRSALVQSDIAHEELQPACNGLRVLVSERLAPDALRAVHRAVVENQRCSSATLRAS
jgi:aspartate kinase